MASLFFLGQYLFMGHDSFVFSENWLLVLLVIINFCFCIYLFFPDFLEFTLSQMLLELAHLFLLKSFNNFVVYINIKV